MVCPLLLFKKPSWQELDAAAAMVMNELLKISYICADSFSQSSASS